MRAVTAIFLALAAAASGCAVGPEYSRPPLTPPASHRGASPQEPAAVPGDLAWVEQFHDPELTALVRSALGDNLEMRQAVQRIMEYRARVAAARATQAPSVVAAANVSPRGRASADADVMSNTYTIGVTLNWEIDFVGRLRRASEAAQAELLASEEGARSVMALLVSDLVQSWFELRFLDEQLAITRRNVQRQESSLEITRLRQQSGVAAGIDEQQAVSQLAGTRVQIPSAERRIMQQENLLCVLLGRPPGPVARTPLTAGSALPPAVPPGLPVDLLTRRSDIRQAEQLLRAATARIGVAAANRFPFPTVGLTAYLGLISPTLDTLVKPDESGVFSWGPTVSLPLFDFGRGRAGEESAVAQAEQAVLAYRQTGLQALREVADALIDSRKLAEQYAQTEIQLAAALEVHRLSLLRYGGGVTDFLEVLDAQRVIYSAEIELSRTRRQQFEAAVRLYRAIGGGWSDAVLKQLTDQAEGARK
jgi:multidrug efflux system outer membrane protein